MNIHTRLEYQRIFREHPQDSFLILCGDSWSAKELKAMIRGVCYVMDPSSTLGHNLGLYNHVIFDASFYAADAVALRWYDNFIADSLASGVRMTAVP